MGIKAVLFDLDGTLLPMDQDEFVKAYLRLLAVRLAPLGYESGKFIESMWAGVGAMVKNDGSCTNEEVFWKVFVQFHGEASLEDKPTIDAFYAEEFGKVQSVCGFHKAAKEVVELVKAKGKCPVLATNPLFPAVATKSRMRWAGLEPEDFAFYTTYENSCFCKPNLKYYQFILEKIGCKPEECLMVGNDVSEDMITEAMGMKVFLLTDCLINKKEQDISGYHQGGFEELKAYLNTVLS